MFDDVQVDGKLVQENFVDGDKTQSGLGDEGYKLTYRVDARDVVATVSPHSCLVASASSSSLSSFAIQKSLKRRRFQTVRLPLLPDDSIARPSIPARPRHAHRARPLVSRVPAGHSFLRTCSCLWVYSPPLRMFLLVLSLFIVSSLFFLASPRLVHRRPLLSTSRPLSRRLYYHSFPAFNPNTGPFSHTTPCSLSPAG